MNGIQMYPEWDESNWSINLVAEFRKLVRITTNQLQDPRFLYKM